MSPDTGRKLAVALGDSGIFVPAAGPFHSVPGIEVSLPPVAAGDPKEPFIIRNPMTDTKRILGYPEFATAVAMALLFAVMMVTFLGFAGWMLGAKPINEIEYYDLENTPPPEYARSFSISHGSAVYYRDDVPSKHPGKRNMVLAVFFGSYGILLVLIIASRRKAKRRGVSLKPDS